MTEIKLPDPSDAANWIESHVDEAEEAGKDGCALYLKNTQWKEVLAAISALRPAEPSAIADVIAERERQISKEGWTAEHDDEHASRELAVVAVCYAQQYVGRAWLLEDFKDGLTRYQDEDLPDEWPAAWHEEWWKPKDPRRDLVRAAALLIAEIDRLDRITPPDLGR